MGFTLWNLIKATVLLLNAAAVLNEKFCLSKCTWGGGCAVCAADQRHSPPVPSCPRADGLDKPAEQEFGPPRSPIKAQLYGMLFASRYLRGSSACWLPACFALLTRLPRVCSAVDILQHHNSAGGATVWVA